MDLLASTAPLTLTLVAIEDAVLIPVDADADSRAWWNACERDFAFVLRRQRPQTRCGNQRRGPLVPAKEASGLKQVSALFAFGHEIAFTLRGALHEKLQTLPRFELVSRRHRDLLADDGREIAIEREHELLNLAAQQEPSGCERKAAEITRILRAGGTRQSLHEELS